MEQDLHQEIETYDTILPLFEKEMMGFGELFRTLSYEEIGPRAMFSRATAGSLQQTAIYVLPVPLMR